jgi:hypothetical protein
MTNLEFSNEFDILYNSITSNNAPGLDEYEKSVFLTMAQESVVRDLYTGSLVGVSFEEQESLRRYLSNMVITAYPEEITEDTPDPISDTSVFYKLPTDVFFITYESAVINDDSAGCKSGKKIDVYPVTQDRYNQIIKNPFRGTTDRRVLRIDAGLDIVELVYKYKIEKYYIKYVKKPKPIILVDLSTLDSTLSINKESVETPCELNDSLHRTILEKAVALAKRSLVIQTVPQSNV